MGNSRSTPQDWATASSTFATQSQQQIFTTTASNVADTGLLPTRFTVRESRDSTSNPNSTPIIIACDTTGSLGHLATELVRKGMATLFTEILNRRPVSDPHLLAMGIGDVKSDRAPVQATQFESSVVILDQLPKVYIEGNGGGDGCESYPAAWYFAAFRTSTDCTEVRGDKGFLFTIGDEMPDRVLKAAHIKQFFGDAAERDITAQELLDAASRSYHVFHLMVEQTSTFKYNATNTRAAWRELLGERAISLTDSSKMAEVIVSILEVITGNKTAGDVSKTWSGDTAVVVSQAIGQLTQGSGSVTTSSAGSVVRFD